MFAAARVLIFAVVIGALTVAKPLYQTISTELGMFGARGNLPL
jgi:hypothetical protein